MSISIPAVALRFAASVTVKLGIKVPMPLGVPLMVPSAARFKPGIPRSAVLQV
jgi:hypothetical protein